MRHVFATGGALEFSNLKNKKIENKMSILPIGGFVECGSTYQMTQLLKDFWREALWTTYLCRFFGARLPADHQGRPLFISDMVAYLLPPPSTYVISAMMNFIPGCGGTVTMPQVLRKIKEVWNPRDHPTWMHAPKGPELVIKIFIDLYYDYSTRNMPFLLERLGKQMVEMDRHGFKRLRL
jgi:hypothetical protein